MRWSLLPLFVVFAASTALAQMPPRHYETGDVANRADDAVDGPGNGLQLELSVFREAGAFSTDSVFSVSGASGIGSVLGGFLSTQQPLASIGYQWDSNALLLGIGVAAVGGSNGSGTTIFFGVTPTFRHYMSPLRTGRISPFIEGSVTISIASLPGGGVGAAGGSTSWGIGAAVNGGAEWLFVRNFGLFGKAGVSYGHINLSSPAGGSSSNLDAAGVQGTVGLSVHL